MAYLWEDGKMMRVRRALKEALFLLLLASVLSLTDFLVFRPLLSSSEEITLAEAKSLWEEGALFIDPRPLLWEKSAVDFK
ncbi:MAG: hypothetical protein DRG32_01755 [Deltaproteobacteria bacterium]|nr:MAG: hypothetical protein DRG32_01755 [Deltaproteobacteria bacterium]